MHFRENETVREIARATSLSRNTVPKYLRMQPGEIRDAGNDGGYSRSPTSPHWYSAARCATSSGRGRIWWNTWSRLRERFLTGAAAPAPRSSTRSGVSP